MYHLKGISKGDLCRLGVKYFEKYLNTNTLKVWNTNTNTYTQGVFEIQILLKAFKYFYNT